MDPLVLDPRSTALVLVDLQRGILARQTAPHAAAHVLSRAVRLADRLRERGALVVLVRVAYAADGRDRLALRVDAPPLGAAQLPADFAELPPELGPKAGDLVITKHQWGAFYGTELDLQLRRRGVRTLVLGGIATNFGVESTARDAYERGYEQVFVEDAMAGLVPGAHEFAVQTIFPRIGLVRTTDDVLKAIAATGR